MHLFFYVFGLLRPTNVLKFATNFFLKFIFLLLGPLAVMILVF